MPLDKTLLYPLTPDSPLQPNTSTPLCVHILVYFGYPIYPYIPNIRPLHPHTSMHLTLPTHTAGVARKRSAHLGHHMACSRPTTIHPCLRLSIHAYSYPSMRDMPTPIHPCLLLSIHAYSYPSIPTPARHPILRYLLLQLPLHAYPLMPNS